MEATPVASAAGAQADDPIAAAFARFRAALRLFYLDSTLRELEEVPHPSRCMLAHYQAERVRVVAELKRLGAEVPS